MNQRNILRNVLTLSLLLMVPTSCKKCTMTLEAENARFTGTIMERSSASNEHTVHLTFAERIEQPFTVHNSHLIEVTGVFYTNDGDSDNMTVSIDGIIVGTVETKEESGKGHLWNVVRNSGPLEKKVSLDPGEHEFQILVTSEDLNGVEVDKITLETNCTEETCRDLDSNTNKCPESMVEMIKHVHTEDEQLRVLLSSTKNTLGLAGVIIGGAFGLINSTVLVIQAILRYRENGNSKEKKKKEVQRSGKKSHKVNETESLVGYEEEEEIQEEGEERV